MQTWEERAIWVWTTPETKSYVHRLGDGGGGSYYPWKTFSRGPCGELLYTDTALTLSDAKRAVFAITDYESKGD